MNEDFVSFDIAKKLKEKGFKEKCFAYYNDNDIEYNYESIMFNNEMWISHNSYDNLWHRDYIDAPTISQVLKWLREEKLILIGLSPMQEYGGDEVVEWCATVYKADKQGGLSWKEEFYYQSYEQAALAGIEYVLNNLI